MLEYGSKLVVSVIPWGGAAVIYDVWLRQYPAKADNQATAEGELVNGLIGVYAAVVVIVIIVGAACRGHRRQVLGFELDTNPWGNVDICPQLKSCGEITAGRISRGRSQDISTQEETEKRSHGRVGNIAGKDRAGHNIVLIKVTAGYLSAAVKPVIVDPRGGGDMIIKYFNPDIAVDIEIYGAPQVQPAGDAAIGIVKVISRGKGIPDLWNKLNGGLCKGAGR